MVCVVREGAVYEVWSVTERYYLASKRPMDGGEAMLLAAIGRVTAMIELFLTCSWVAPLLAQQAQGKQKL